MRNTFDIAQLAYLTFGLKTLPFPWIPNRNKTVQAQDFDVNIAAARKENTAKGSQLYAQDSLGGWYFMPVFITHQGTKYELDNAIISITTKKTIVETPLVGVRGAVKELISIDDYKISIKGFLTGEDYPEQKVEELKSLFEINQAVELESAITDILLPWQKKVVITALSLPPTPGVETIQAYSIELTSDQPFELIIQ